MRTLEVEVAGPGSGREVGAARAAGRGLHRHLDPRRDADPAQWLPAAQAPPRLEFHPAGVDSPPSISIPLSGAGCADDPRNVEMMMTVIQKNWQELIRPKKLQVAAGDDAKRVATVVAEPLERGFGVTLGNALRRVLLSSLQGAAVQSVHIDGVLHEFSSIPGVREDVTDIVLNIKDIAIKMQGDGPKRMVVKKQGPGTSRPATSRWSATS